MERKTISISTSFGLPFCHFCEEIGYHAWYKETKISFLFPSFFLCGLTNTPGWRRALDFILDNEQGHGTVWRIPGSQIDPDAHRIWFQKLVSVRNKGARPFRRNFHGLTLVPTSDLVERFRNIKQSREFIIRLSYSVIHFLIFYTFSQSGEQQQTSKCTYHSEKTRRLVHTWDVRLGRWRASWTTWFLPIRLPKFESWE